MMIHKEVDGDRGGNVGEALSNSVAFFFDGFSDSLVDFLFLCGGDSDRITTFLSLSTIKFKRD